ncbi:MAG: SGNH/GDSL hydrolase family protein [Verrucomicrobiales bacterium]
MTPTRCRRLALAALIAAALSPQATADPLSLKDGDRVVLLGNTVIERAASYGYVEAALTAAHPDAAITFRNLGWSGDTVFGDARSYFGPPEEGFQRLEALLKDLKPSVVIACYGAFEAFDGPEAIPGFIGGYGRLLDMVDQASPGCRVCLVSPPPLENLGAPLPDQAETNASLAAFRDAIGKLAADRGEAFADLFAAMGGGSSAIPENPLTENGVHFTESGYRQLAAALLKAMGVSADGRYHLNADARGAEIAFAPATLPFAGPPTLTAAGLEKGKYTIASDGKAIAGATAQELAEGIALEGCANAERFEKLRQSIIVKNRLYFHRWRPANETYLHGFRKHEQGQNAKEMPMFEPLVAEKEKEIAALRTPVKETIKVN